MSESDDEAVLASDLTAVRRAVEFVNEAPESALLALDDVLELPSDDWLNRRWTTIPALVLLRLQHSIGGLFDILQGQPADGVTRQPGWAAVFKARGRTRHFALDMVSFVLLSELQRGATLGDAVAHALGGALDPAARQKITGWLRMWVEEGVFASVGRVQRDAAEVVQRCKSRP